MEPSSFIAQPKATECVKQISPKPSVLLIRCFRHSSAYMLSTGESGIGVQRALGFLV